MIVTTIRRELWLWRRRRRRRKLRRREAVVVEEEEKRRRRDVVVEKEENDEEGSSIYQLTPGRGGGLSQSVIMVSARGGCLAQVSADKL